MSTIGIINISLEVFGCLVSLIIILCLLVSENGKTKLDKLFIGVLLCNSMVLLSDAMAWAVKGNMQPFFVVASRIANFCVYSFGYVLLAVFTNYFLTYLGTKAPISRIIARIVGGMCALAVALVVLSQFNHMYYSLDQNNIYHRGQFFWLSQVWGIAGMLINAIMLFKHRKKLTTREFWFFFSYVLLPILAMVIQIWLYGLALLYIATTLAVLMIYLGIQADQVKRLKQKELELTQNRISIMLSQIQPHFLYNSLTAIAMLCELDPQKAKKATIEFATYLRGNLDSLKEKKPVPFERELEHVKTYLYLEQMRFGDQLIIVFDIGAREFFLPSLTVQPIVENAVKYGVGRKAQGGTVTLSTRETDTGFEVQVSDDGVGYDPEQTQYDGRTHIGIDNVRQRLWAQCKGELSIESQKDVGTVAMITIPKGETK